MPRTRNSHQLRATPRMASLDTALALVSGIEMSLTTTHNLSWLKPGLPWPVKGERESPGTDDSLRRSAVVSLTGAQMWLAENIAVGVGDLVPGPDSQRRQRGARAMTPRRRRLPSDREGGGPFTCSG